MSKKIIFHGFRATGKTTAGIALIEKLGSEWNLVEMDEEIEKIAGKKINEITEGGTKWQEFRQMESDLFEKLLDSDKNLIISTGGGLCVNDILKNETNQTFGKINKKMLEEKMKNQDIVSIILDGEPENILKYIEEQEREKIGRRPVLDEKLAKDMEEKTKNMSENEKKDFIIKNLLDDSRKMFEKRRPLYQSIPGTIVNVSNFDSFDDVVEKIWKILNSK